MANPNVMLITRPFYDKETTYLSEWNEDVINFAKSNKKTVIDLKDKDANRSNLEKRIGLQDPKLVIFNGHGGANVITGYEKNHILVQGDVNDHILSSRIVSSITCKSAKELGPKCVNKGTKAFIGFEEEFAFIREKSRGTNPKKDKKAEIFLTITNSIPINFLKGFNAGEIVEKCKIQFDKQIEFYTTHYDYGTQHILTWLRHDRRVLKLHGRPEARL